MSPFDLIHNVVVCHAYTTNTDMISRKRLRETVGQSAEANVGGPPAVLDMQFYSSVHFPATTTPTLRYVYIFPHQALLSGVHTLLVRSPVNVPLVACPAIPASFIAGVTPPAMVLFSDGVLLPLSLAVEQLPTTAGLGLSATGAFTRSIVFNGSVLEGGKAQQAGISYGGLVRDTGAMPQGSMGQVSTCLVNDEWILPAETVGPSPRSISLTRNTRTLVTTLHGVGDSSGRLNRYHTIPLGFAAWGAVIPNAALAFAAAGSNSTFQVYPTVELPRLDANDYYNFPFGARKIIELLVTPAANSAADVAEISFISYFATTDLYNATTTFTHVDSHTVQLPDTTGALPPSAIVPIAVRQRTSAVPLREGRWIATMVAVKAQTQPNLGGHLLFNVEEYLALREAAVFGAESFVGTMTISVSGSSEIVTFPTGDSAYVIPSSSAEGPGFAQRRAEQLAEEYNQGLAAASKTCSNP